MYKSFIPSPYILSINIHPTTSILLNTSKSQNNWEGTIINSPTITIAQFLFKIIGAKAEKSYILLNRVGQKKKEPQNKYYFYFLWTCQWLGTQDYKWITNIVHRLKSNYPDLFSCLEKLIAELHCMERWKRSVFPNS